MGFQPGPNNQASSSALQGFHGVSLHRFSNAAQMFAIPLLTSSASLLAKIPSKWVFRSSSHAGLVVSSSSHACALLEAFKVRKACQSSARTALNMSFCHASLSLARCLHICFQSVRASWPVAALACLRSRLTCRLSRYLRLFLFGSVTPTALLTMA